MPSDPSHSQKSMRHLDLAPSVSGLLRMMYPLRVCSNLKIHGPEDS